MADENPKREKVNGDYIFRCRCGDEKRPDPKDVERVPLERRWTLMSEWIAAFGWRVTSITTGADRGYRLLCGKCTAEAMAPTPTIVTVTLKGGL